MAEQGSIIIEEQQTAPLLARDTDTPLVKAKKDLTGTVIYDDGVKVEITSGYIEFIPEVTVAADFDGLRLMSFDCEVTGTVNMKMVVKATADAQGDHDYAKKLATFRKVFVQFIPTVPPVPVWEEVALELWVGFVARTESEGWVQAGFESSSGLSIGAKLRNGDWSSYITPKHDFAPVHPDWQIGG